MAKKEISTGKLVIEYLEGEIEMFEEEAHIAEKNAGELRRAISILKEEEKKRAEWKKKREEEDRRLEEDEDEEEEEEGDAG